MSDELTMAQRCRAVGRMLQIRPTEEALEAFASALPAYEKPQLEAAEQDFLKLFVGVGTPLAPPWESTWASDARLLFQRETLDVRYWYRDAGLQITRLHHEPDDHIGLELEFVGLLLERGDADTAAAFAAAHPKAWVARWCAAVQAHAETPFYRQLAAEAQELLAGL